MMKRSAKDRFGLAPPPHTEPRELDAETPQADAPEDDEGEEAGAHPATVNGVSGAELKAFIERIERLEEEKKDIATDIKDVFAEAKGRGFDTKAMRAILRFRKMDADQRAEHEAIVDLYMVALGMVPFESTELGEAAEQREAGAHG